MQKITIYGTEVELLDDAKLSIQEYALYRAGQLDILYKCIDNGLLTMNDAAHELTEKGADFTAGMVEQMRPVWDEGGDLAQRDMMHAMWIALMSLSDVRKNKHG